MPVTQRLRQKSSIACQFSGGRYASDRHNLGLGLALRRISPGANCSCRKNASLKRRRLLNPAAAAISVTLNEVSCNSFLANRICPKSAYALGERPRRCWNNRRRYRSLIPKRSASAGKLVDRKAPASINLSARVKVVSVPRQAQEPGALSGRQRKQGR